MLRVVSTVLIVTLVATPVVAQPAEDEQVPVLRAYVEKIAAGTRVRVTLADGSRLRGVLMLVDDDDLVLRERKRLPEPPRRIPLQDVSDVEVEHNGGSIAKAAAIAAGVAVAATLVVIAFLAAMLDD